MFGNQQLYSQQTGATPVMTGFSANASTQDKFTEFVKQVGAEMNTWEKTGQWLLSSLCPMKEYPLVPGFEDTSYEELRVAAYLARTDTAAMQEYQKMLDDKFARHKQLRDALRAGTPEALQVLKEVFYSKPAGTTDTTSTLGDSTSATNGGGTFGQPSAGAGGTAFGGGLFGSSSTNATPSLFGAQTQTTSAFGASPAFGSLGGSSVGVMFGAPTKPLFGSTGGSAFSMTPTSPIGSDPSKTSVFGGQQQSTSLFGASQQSAQSVMFGGGGGAATAPNTTSSLFGNASAGSNSVFGLVSGNTGGTGMFGSAASGVSKNLFGASTTTAANTGGLFGTQGSSVSSGSSSVFGSTSTSVFGGGSAFSPMGTNNNSNTNNSSVFGGQSEAQSQSLFGAVPTLSQASIFGGSSASTVIAGTPEKQHSSIFGGAGTPQSSVFGGSTSLTPQTATTNPSGSIFGGGQQSTFGGSSAPSLFGGSSVVSSSFTTGQPQQSVFGGQQTSASSAPLFGGGSSSATVAATKATAAADPSDERYTPLDRISEEDRIQYQAETFTYVPLMPPPRELCF